MNWRRGGPCCRPRLSTPKKRAIYQKILLEACQPPCQSLLELGSGGGNNASYLKQRFGMVLVDRSPGMLDVSRQLNPECEHHQGDMRSVRLEREFDAVFVHDAVAYMTSEADLRRAIDTAYVHCRPGGAALFAPDHVREFPAVNRSRRLRRRGSRRALSRVDLGS